MKREYPELYILRHGQTVWNVAGKFQGHLNSPLTELGKVQALQQRDILNREAVGGAFDLHCSTLGRTRETAAIAFEGREGPVAYDARLMEISVGEMSGLTILDMEEEFPDVMQGRMPFVWNFHCPGGETYPDICERVQSWLDDLSGPTIVVTHGITSRIIRGLLLGLDLEGVEGLPGGQGVVYFVKDGVHHQFEA
ncbi:MAG: histidine phosphatase family protein [Paracoccaceae bacterium]